MGVSTGRRAASRVAASRRTAVPRSMDALDGTGDGVVDHRAPKGGRCRGAERLQRGRGSSGGTSVRLQLPPAGWPLSPPPPQAPDEIAQHEELFEHRHALPLPPELAEKPSQPPPPRPVEPERLGETFLRVLPADAG